MESRPCSWAGCVGEAKKEIEASVSSSRMEKASMANDQGITKVEKLLGEETWWDSEVPFWTSSVWVGQLLFNNLKITVAGHNRFFFSCS